MQEFDVSFEKFVYYAFVVTATLYTISFSIELILKRVSSLPSADISLISRRIAAVSIYFVTFLLLAQALYIMFMHNRFLTKNLPPPSSHEFWGHNKIPKETDSDLQKLWFYVTKTDITFTAYKQSQVLIQIALTINAAFNGIDMFFMYFYDNGFSATGSSLIMFHHWTLIWIESCIFNLDLLMIHPDWNWRFVLIGLILIVGCIGDLCLAPSTIKCFVKNENSLVYQKLLWLHLVFNLLIMRGAGVSMIAFDLITTLWQMDWKYGASFQISMIFMW
eukprot:CAMPEP_0202704002 /NCGR_PEP_ID=MMETSP1385-20130828/16765_1 /ASSEMBLY_ACC=CAM_ASM_000861 /TAXON_ID=933848 /ORGANISM="Elphidium margaritaceum" /LENGTH=275 /DNA_ID=CAMNT_0049361937 /DNA_START=79 /DNA_END=903 /DNA_ORIENTATION=+